MAEYTYEITLEFRTSKSLTETERRLILDMATDTRAPISVTHARVELVESVTHKRRGGDWE